MLSEQLNTIWLGYFISNSRFTCQKNWEENEALWEVVPSKLNLNKKIDLNSSHPLSEICFARGLSPTGQQVWQLSVWRRNKPAVKFYSNIQNVQALRIARKSLLWCRNSAKSVCSFWRCLKINNYLSDSYRKSVFFNDMKGKLPGQTKNEANFSVLNITVRILHRKRCTD